jgi:tetratricopeptide (TPR) repeat protein
VGIKQQAVAAWLFLAASDTTAAEREARAAADREDVTAKHPVTPGELLPARELEGDLLFTVGQYARARAAYEAALRGEPGRARSLFGAARAAEVSGDPGAARAQYQAFLTLMEHADGARPELGVARAFLTSSGP